MQFTIETEQQEDGRLIAEVLDLSGVMKYGKSRAESLALRVLADRLADN